MKANCEYCDKEIEVMEGDWEVCDKCEAGFLRAEKYTSGYSEWEFEEQK